MRIEPTPAEMAEKSNVFEIEEEELAFVCETAEGEGTSWLLTGIAESEGERWHGFEIELSLAAAPAANTVSAIIAAEWESYDFVF